MLTQDEFERDHAKRSNVTIESWRAYYIGLPCGCGDESCAGWAAVSRNPDSVAEYLDFYSPGAPRTLTVDRFRRLGYR